MFVPKIFTLIYYYLIYVYIILDTSTMGTFRFLLLSLTMGLVFVAVCAASTEGKAEPESTAEPEGEPESTAEPEGEPEGNAASMKYPHVFTAAVSLFAYAMFK